MPREYKMYINGEWVSALDGETYDDYNPSDSNDQRQNRYPVFV